MTKWNVAYEADQDALVDAFNSLNILNNTVEVPNKNAYMVKFEENIWDVYGLFSHLHWWKKIIEEFAEDVSDYIRSVN